MDPEYFHKCEWCYKNRKSKLVKYQDGFDRALCFSCRRRTFCKSGVHYLKEEFKNEM